MPAIIVVIKEGAARTQRLRKIFLAEGSVVVLKKYARFARDIDKADGDLLRLPTPGHLKPAFAATDNEFVVQTSQSSGGAGCSEQA